MNDNILAAIIGASAAVIGVLLGQVITFVNNIIQRKWEEFDFNRNRKVITVEKRIEQIEQYVEVMTKKVYKTKDDIAFHLINNGISTGSDRIIEWAKWKNESDATNYYYGLAIQTLGDEKIINIYESLRNKASDLETQLIELLTAKYSDKTKINESEYSKKASEIFGEYSRLMSDFFIRMDWIKVHISK